MDRKKVFIENWPKTKPLLLEWAPIIVAIIAVGFSGYSMYLSRKGFIASHRPYVWAGTHGYLDNNNKVVVDVNTLRKLCLNAPAKIIVQEYSYIVVKEDGSKDTILKESGIEKFIMYPADPKVSQEWHTMDANKLNSAINDPSIKKILRKVRIEYKEVSSNRKYFFEGEWEYNKERKDWKPIKSEGN
jgi:hypothetical protein